MGLSEEQNRRFQDYIRSHKTIISDRIAQEFFQIEENIILLLKALDGDQDGQKALEEKFRKYFFRIRFSKFLASTIKYTAIGYMRLNQKNDKRFQLIFDIPFNQNSDDNAQATFGEMVLSIHNSPTSYPIISNPTQFQSTFLNEELSNAFSKLSNKQQLIATLGYALCYKDHEIARILGVSQQSISKTRNLALEKMRISLLERKGKHEK
ncbi:sigma-70 family RNA polymerase sigma factor [Paenibacillus pini]|uniref:RNA polymerase sigma-70 region 4 domain-containing protein n=1 Tax=Paenibacillus pini JCM 16418 TaxID=1236976 RepID=W7YZM7_9BACL|nr:sigma-70 family RNA polymerase sigma factor [Paenibacillus pini]GAF07844.1 hypothetical protein JCM16418_1875 [Paenibacillus pini JCM 16418]